MPDLRTGRWFMSNIFNWFAKSLIEANNGKIHKYSNGFVFSDAGTTNNQGVFLKPSEAKDGRKISLALSVLTASNCPQPPGDYPQSKRGGFWVPMKVCRKCPHHIKRRRRQPYPCCDVLRKIRANGPTPAQQMIKVMQDAVERTKEIIK